MNDVVEDIEILSNVVIALQEGASDEKRMAVDSIQRLLERKKTELQQFESSLDEEFCLDSNI